MGFVSDGLMYGRLARGLRGFLRARLPVQEARRIVRQRMQRRDEEFLRILRRGVFGHPRSPYLPLLEMAGCGFGDVEQMVRRRGLEGALEELYEAGVYVTFEELKGRAPIVRNGRELPVAARDFDNPYLSRHYETQTGGSTGAATRIAFDFNHTLAGMPVRVLEQGAHGLLDMPTALWRGILPAVAGISVALGGVVTGNIPRRWFSPLRSRDESVRLRHRLATAYVLGVSGLLGVRLPRPEWVRLDRPGPVVDWAARTLRAEGRCCLSAFVSTALRFCLAAAERGVSLEGAVVTGGGEPPTPAKVRAIEAAGARWVPAYWISEAGQVGVACAEPLDGNDLHVARDCIALIHRPRRVPGWDVSVDAFHVTTLLPTSPKILLNAGVDDYGLLEKRSCGCPLEGLGYDLHVRQIRSYGKLTGEGVTLIDCDTVRIFEDLLPARFGGSPLDYQLLEEEDERGLTRLALLVSPRVGIPDDGDVVRAVLEALEGGGHRGAFAASFWKQARSLQIRRQEPVWSAGGKFMPLCVAERIRDAGRDSAPKH